MTREEKLLNRQSKETLIKLYLRANAFRKRDVELWDYVRDAKSVEFWEGLRLSSDPKGYVLDEMQGKGAGTVG